MKVKTLTITILFLSSLLTFTINVSANIQGENNTAEPLKTELETKQEEPTTTIKTSLLLKPIILDSQKILNLENEAYMDLKQCISETINININFNELSENITKTKIIFTINNIIKSEDIFRDKPNSEDISEKDDNTEGENLQDNEINISSINAEINNKKD
jgi:hypothetical protein